MIADFTFTLSNASYHINRDGHEWLARCAGNFLDTSRDSFPLRGDVAFLNRIPIEVCFKLRREGALDRAHMARGLDDQIERWRSEGYACEGDAYLMRYWPPEGDTPAFIGMTTTLTKEKFEYFHECMLRCIGRSDLSARLICKFHGFSEPYSEMSSVPTKNQFLAGSHYFVLDEQSIVIAARLPG